MISGSIKKDILIENTLARKNATENLFIFFSFLVNPYSVFGLEPDWSEYDQILGKYVSSRIQSGIPVNWVDYSGISRDPIFNKLVQSIETFPTEQLKGLAEKLGFYINAYNILAIKMVLDY
ncbi:MAG: hypothetical protein HY356_04055 [Gammaproteobacteria bacterium]|nr:hypothetical protein [Gammaproteobacteria bacterium]